VGTDMQRHLRRNTWERFRFDFGGFRAREISRETRQHGRMPRLDLGRTDRQMAVTIFPMHARPKGKSPITPGHNEIRLQCDRRTPHYLTP
jgi:hypothetical protein